MAKFAIVYGQTDFFSQSGLKTLFVSTEKEVKELAEEFVTVIPDDLESVLEDIQNWDSSKRLLITHQDDDTFYFSAELIQDTTDFTDFTDFVKNNQV